MRKSHQDRVVSFLIITLKALVWVSFIEYLMVDRMVLDRSTDSTSVHNIHAPDSGYR